MLNNAALELRAAADALATEPGTSARPTLIAGLRDSANGLEEIAGLYWLRDGLTRTQNALQPIVDNQPVSTDTCRSTALMLNNAAPELRAAANALAAKPGTSARPTLIAGLRDSANGLEEIAGLYWLRDGLAKTQNALRPIVDNQTVSTDTCRSTASMLNNAAPELRAAADALAAKPGTSARPALIAGLRDSANGLEEIAGLYWRETASPRPTMPWCLWPPAPLSRMRYVTPRPACSGTPRRSFAPPPMLWPPSRAPPPDRL